MFNKQFYFFLFLGVAECLSHCLNVHLSPEIWKNEGAAVIYVMKSSPQNWQTHVTALVHLLKNLKNIDVNANLIVVTNKNCSMFDNVKEFKIETGEIWEKMKHPNEYPEAYIVDRCGKVTYHIIFPWSLVKWFPFIKGALLSTFFDKPCGFCDEFSSHQIEIPENHIISEEVKIYPKMSLVSKKLSDETIPPIEIIIKEKHKHKGNDEIFEYTEMELGNNQYHRHFHNIDDMEFSPTYSTDHLALVNQDNLLILDGSDTKQIEDHFKHSTYKKKRKTTGTRSDEDKDITHTETKAADLDRKINEIALKCTGVINNELDDKYYEKLFESLLKTVYAPEEKFTEDENEEREEVSHHYEKLNNWMSYII